MGLRPETGQGRPVPPHCKSLLRGVLKPMRMGDIGGGRAYGMAMHKWLRASEGAGGLLVVLLLVALAIRALVPAGYMPVRSADGLVISLCNGQGTVPLVVDVAATGDIRIMPADGDDGHRGTPHDSDGLCIFSALTAPALQVAAPPIAAAVGLVLRAAAPIRPAALLLAQASFVRPPLRGPPLAG